MALHALLDARCFFPLVGQDEPWIAAPAARLATQGVYGDDLFAGYYGMERRTYNFPPLFPASLARHGDWIYVSNLSLDLRLFGLPQSVDSQWAAQVTRHTISRLRARIPRD